MFGRQLDGFSEVSIKQQMDFFMSKLKHAPLGHVVAYGKAFLGGSVSWTILLLIIFL